MQCHQAKDVHQGSLALPIPDQEPHRGLSGHLSVFGSVIIEVSGVVGRLNLAKRPIADVVARILARTEYLDEGVASGVQIALNRPVGSIRVPNHHGKSLLDNLIQAVSDVQAESVNTPRSRNKDYRQR